MLGPPPAHQQRKKYFQVLLQQFFLDCIKETVFDMKIQGGQKYVEGGGPYIHVWQLARCITWKGTQRVHSLPDIPQASIQHPVMVAFAHSPAPTYQQQLQASCVFLLHAPHSRYLDFTRLARTTFDMLPYTLSSQTSMDSILQSYACNDSFETCISLQSSSVIREVSHVWMSGVTLHISHCSFCLLSGLSTRSPRSETRR